MEYQQIIVRLNHVRVGESCMLHWFECGCCHQVRISQEAVMLVQYVRNALGPKVEVVRGYVCSQGARLTRKGTLSAHHWGNAVDLTGHGIQAGAIAEVAAFFGGRNLNINSRRNTVHVEVNVPTAKIDVRKDGKLLPPAR